jgi:hypothetical protein
MGYPNKVVKSLTLITIVVFLFFLSNVSIASEWARVYGSEEIPSSYPSGASTVQKTSDGGYVVAGEGPLIKLDKEFKIQWQKGFPGQTIQQTLDGGYILGATSVVTAKGQSSALPAFPQPFQDRILLSKLDDGGLVEWQKVYYGGGQYTGAESVLQTVDGGYIVAGSAQAFSPWILKLDSGGNVLWQKIFYVGQETYSGSSLIERVSDNGYILSHGPYVFRLDSTGNVQWQKKYGSRGTQGFYSLKYTSDGGYVLAGWTNSSGAGTSDAWIIKLDGTGNISWQKTYGGTGEDQVNSILQTSDGGYIAVGKFDLQSLWILKLDEKGNPEWQKIFRGQLETGFEIAYSIQETSDEGYLVVGFSNSFGTISNNYNYLVLKVDSNGDIPDCSFIRTSNSTVMNSDASAEDISFPGVDTNIVPEIVHIDPIESDVAESAVCPFASVETISAPTTPIGQRIGKTGLFYTFTTGGCVSSLSNPIEYQFDWKGDGSDLSDWGLATQSKSWFASGVYNVRARGRSVLNVFVTSDWTNPLTVSISVPKILVTPMTYDFGKVKVKRNKTVSFNVTNSGTVNLLMSALLTGTDASMFKITSGNGVKTIKPGRTLIIRVVFKPTSTGSKSAKLGITSDDPNSPTIDIPLSGTGQ